MSDDVLVVGSGLGGCLAAATAAQKTPASRIRLLAPDEERFDYHSGLIDVLGYTPVNGADSALSELPAPVDNPLAALTDLPDDHPYSLLGPEVVREALATFDRLCPAYRGNHTEKNALVMTPGGRPTPAARYPASMAPGLLSRPEAALLVGFEQIPDFDSHLVADVLDSSLSYDVTSLPVEFPTQVTEYPAGPQLAAILDENLPVDDTVGDSERKTSVREALADLIRPELDLEPRVGLPAVLGRQAHDEIRRELRNTLSARVFEIPVGPPSIPGRRLYSRLQASLSEAGVTVESECEITGFETAAGRIECVQTEAGAYDAREFVLATGDLETGGLVADSAGVREPVFDCHVSHSTDSSEWVAREFLGDHPFARFGVDVDESLRPLDSSGSVEYENLRAVGELLGGPDYIAEQSGDGVAIATGYAAGRRAGERL